MGQASACAELQLRRATSLLVILFLGAALLHHAQAAEFSHKLHLKMVPKCVDCHSDVVTSTRIEDNNLPNEAKCVRCHTGGRTIRPPERTQINRFSHQQHLQPGNISKLLATAIDKKNYLSAKPTAGIRQHLEGNQNPCTACHRGIEQNEAISHDNLPQMADCLVCHSKIDPPDSCATCHAKTMVLKPANHVEGFFSDHSSAKMVPDKTSCATCHGRRFTCLGCH